MTGFRLLRLCGEQQPEEWCLDTARYLLVGRGVPGEAPPDVDLWPDRRVGRQHARVWLEGTRWRIEDLGSKNGTVVGDIEIKGQGPVWLEPGVEIQMGDTVLMLAHPNWHRLHWGPLIIDLELAPAINYSLVHCGLPIVKRLVARNWDTEESGRNQLAIAIAGYGNAPDIAIPGLSVGESRDLPRPEFHFNVRALENQVERCKTRVSVKLHGRPAEGGDMECCVLAHNEWSHATEHRLALASFVLSNHPLVEQLTHDACQRLRTDVEAEQVLEAIYRHLSTEWDLAYRHEPPSSDSDSQKVRLPHQVLLNFDERRGQGTCIDLALLIAACLEQTGLHPLIAILDGGGWRHALVGCWLGSRTSLEPLLFEARRALTGALWVDPTGCTQDPGCQLTFDESREKAQKCLAEMPFLFAMDIAAARGDGINPLPFAGEPGWSESVAQAIVRAADCARSIGPLSPGTVHLLAGLLSIDGGVTQEVFRMTGVEPSRALQRLKDGLRRAKGSEGELLPTPHHEQALAGARALAKRAGSPLVTEWDMLMGLLELRSDALEKALHALGATRGDLLAVAQSLRGATTRRTRSVFSEFPSVF